MQQFTCRLLAALFFACLFTTAHAQTPSVDKQPAFPGGVNAMMEFLGNNIKYPESARLAKAEATVFVRFTVDKDGRLGDFSTLNKGETPHPDLVLEALRVLKSMPIWTPGEKDGQAVKAEMVLPVKFKLE